MYPFPVLTPTRNIDLGALTYLWHSACHGIEDYLHVRKSGMYRSLFVVILSMVLVSCHDSPRKNPADPAVADRRTIEGDVELKTQEDLEALINQGAGSFEITGSLLIQRSTLKSLKGLNSLTEIGDDLLITHNDSLESLEGLNNLTTVGRDLWLQTNDSLLTPE